MAEWFPEPDAEGWWWRRRDAKDRAPQPLYIVHVPNDDNPLAAKESKFRVRHTGFGSPVDAYLSTFPGEWLPADWKDAEENNRLREALENVVGLLTGAETFDPDLAANTALMALHGGGQ